VAAPATVGIALALATSTLAAAGLALFQKPGTAGCISETGTGGACADGTALDGARSVTISADGKNAYVASSNSDAVAVFDRDTTTGALTQKEGSGACWSDLGSAGGACIPGPGLDGAGSVAITADGKNAYVASNNSDAVASFERDTTTGALIQNLFPNPCTSETGSPGCADGTALDGAYSVATSADGKSAYVASTNSDAVAIFDREPTAGGLIQKSGFGGCISETGTGVACIDGVALDGARSVAISPDGKSAYVASFTSDAVASFDRDTSTGATTGALTQKFGLDACISELGPGAPECLPGSGLAGAVSVAISPDGKSAYVASFASSAVAIFDRDTTTGALTQKPGTAGCISETGTGGACADGTALNGASSVAISPDGQSAYVASNDINGGAMAIFDRDTATGALTQKQGPYACISETGTDGACADGTAVNGPISVATSPDGRSAYGTSINSDAVAIFDRGPIPGPGPGPTGGTGAGTGTGTTSTATGQRAAALKKCKKKHRAARRKCKRAANRLPL
jgi:DNA-binding beta-propeller fold protein YncE